MTIREKLLLELGKNPAYEGADETEKALVKELKAELDGSGDGDKQTADSIDAEAKAIASQIAKEIGEIIKTSKVDDQSEKGQTRPGADDVNNGFDIDAEISEKSKGMSKAMAKKFAKAYRTAEFVKALFDNKVNGENNAARIKALGEAGTGENGGYLVPEEFRAQLIQNLLSTNSFRSLATVIPMTTNSLKIPRLSGDVQVRWGTENKAIATTSADFGEMELTPFRMNAIIRTSRELFNDSAIAIAELLQRRFTDRVRDEENKVFFGGNGTTQPKGIDAETLKSISAANALTPDHITKAYWKLPEQFRANGVWFINSRVMEHLENSKESGTGAYLYPSLQGEVKTLKGRPVFVSDYVPSTLVWFGDPSQYFIGDRQQVTMDVSTEEGSTWEKYQIAWRLIERIDGELSLTTSFVEITNTNIS